MPFHTLKGVAPLKLGRGGLVHQFVDGLPHPQRCGSVEATMVDPNQTALRPFHTLKGVAPLKPCPGPCDE